jgi:spermidine synthase
VPARAVGSARFVAVKRSVPLREESPAAAALARRLPFLVAVSGATALVYESLWMRSFGLIFGNTTDAVALVLATFMGGLAMGSLLVARRRAAAPLRAYAFVELGIGTTALLTLPLLEALPHAYGALAAHAALAAPIELVGRAVAAALVILPPTLLLGATVPLVVEFLSRAGREFRASFGRLYLLNTLGGAAGVFAVAFLLVPTLGVTASFVLAALLNLTIGAVAWRWSREVPAAAVLEQRPTERTRLPASFAVLALLSGACSFGLEILWTRSYALVIGSSVYAFNLMLLAVLIGIATGTTLYGRLGSRVKEPATALAVLFLLLGGAILVGEAVVGLLPVAFLALMKVLPVTFAAHQVAGFTLCLVTMLPVTIVLGLSFPLLTHLLSTERHAPQEASGLLYAWNTAGAIAGAIATDFLLVGRLGLQRSFVLLAAAPLLAGLWVLGRAAPWQWPVRTGVLLAVAAVLVLFGIKGRTWDPLLMSSGVYTYGLEWKDRLASATDLGSELARERRLLFYEEGREAVVAVIERPSGKRFLSVNGKTDAGNGAEDVLTQKFIAHVPLLLHPEPRRVLVIGWGAGATAASASLHPVTSLECVEIEPATFRAASFFADLNGPLAKDPRFRIVFRDGRNHLLRSALRYDVIVSEPSNPWISGVSNLFTEDFYAIARDRLAEGGIFGQWFHYYNLEPGDVKVELKSFLRVFPHASVWLVPPVKASADTTANLGADMLLVGSRGPHAFDGAKLRRVVGEGDVGKDLAATGVLGDETALLATWALDRADLERYVEDPALFPGGTPVNTDDWPYIEFQAPRRNVMAPADVARAAIREYEALAEAARDVTPPIRGHAALDAGGSAAAAFLRDLAARQIEAALPGRALRTLEASVALDPSSGAAQARLGELLLQRGRPEEAEARLREAVRLDPSLEKPFELLGALLIDKKDYAAAESVHRAMIRHHPRAVAAYLRLGAVLARQSRWAEAREALDEARAIDPAAPVDPALLAFLERQAQALPGSVRR